MTSTSTANLRARTQHEAYKIVYLQLICLLSLSCLIWLISGTQSAYSALLGGLAYWFPNLVFVWRVFRYAGAQQMTKFMAAFYTGEMLKLILSAILFLLIVNYLSVSLLSVLIGFIGAIVSFWVGCIWYFSKQQLAKQRVAK